MIRILINGNPVHAREDATILEASYEDKYAVQQFDIRIPTLHYLRGVQNRDTSGIAVVEVKGRNTLVDASVTKVSEGMEITTNSPGVVEKQKEILAEILEHHDLDCIACGRTGNCELQSLQWKFRMTKNPDEAKRKDQPVDDSGIIVRDHNKCIRCGRCVAACRDLQGIGAIAMEGEGLAGNVVTVGAKTLSESSCVNCGQCITVCPVGALRERDDTEAVFEAIADPDKFVVIQAAPSVRASVGEYFNYPIGTEIEGKLAAALRRLGFDRVFDTTFGADLTIMEEATEFLDRVKNDGVLPMMTSCCPGWIKYCEHQFPELLPNVSSCKSPQQMFGAVIKSYYAKKEGIPKENIVVVSTMPCTAKKFEMERENQSGSGVRDVDFSITARELGRMIERAEIPFLSLADEAFDSPLGTGSGAGVIFGATGGVMEAALRTAADWLSGDALEQVEYQAVRGLSGVKEAEVKIGSTSIKVAAVSGLANAKKLMQLVKEGKSEYQFIEVMACPGGCVNGGGQPQQLASKLITKDMRALRATTLYGLDEGNAIRKSHENPEIIQYYREFQKEPGNELGHQLLHTAYAAR